MKALSTCITVLTVLTFSSAQQLVLISPPHDTVVKTDTLLFRCDVNNPNGIDSVKLFSDLSGVWQETSRQKAPSGEYAYNASMQLWMHLNRDPLYNESDSYVFDFSNKGHNGTVQGATFVSDGHSGGAYSFNGGSSCIKMPSNNFNLPGSSGATLAAWVKPSDGQSSAAGSVVYIDYKGSTNTRLLLTVNSNRTVSVKARSKTETLQTTTSKTALPANTWSHIAGVVNLSAKTLQIYINGTLSIQETKSFNQTRFYSTTATNACIGGILGSTSYSFKGVIDELAMYNRALSAAEVKALAQSAATQWSPTFTVALAPKGTFSWNCVARDPQGNQFWGASNWSFTNREYFKADYVEPTPGDDTVWQVDFATIKVKGTDELAVASLTWLKNSREKTYRLSVDPGAWTRWGFCYPVTYIFELTDVAGVEVLQRDTSIDAWQSIPVKTGAEFFNGIEAVRIGSDQKTVYVSVGFKNRPVVFLKVNSPGTVTYKGVARFYDNRKAVYTLSIDNWAGNMHTGTNAGVPCQTMTDDNGDKYQAAVWACRLFQIPVSVAINTRVISMTNVWPLIQAEIDAGAMEPAVHSCTHPCSDAAYKTLGYVTEILGCRNDLLNNLHNIFYGNNRIFEFVIPCGYENTTIYQTAKNEFLFLRRWSGSDNPSDTIFASWDGTYLYYRGGLETKSYDVVFEARTTKARYYAADVTKLNSAFTAVYTNGGIFYAMWHPDRYTNSVIYDTRTPVDGTQGSSLMQHLAYVSGRTDVWYVTNGWLYDYHKAAENVRVDACVATADSNTYDMTIDNNNPDFYAAKTFYGLGSDSAYYYRITVKNVQGDSVSVPMSPAYRKFEFVK